MKGLRGGVRLLDGKPCVLVLIRYSPARFPRPIAGCLRTLSSRLPQNGLIHRVKDTVDSCYSKICRIAVNVKIRRRTLGVSNSHCLILKSRLVARMAQKIVTMLSHCSHFFVAPLPALGSLGVAAQRREDDDRLHTTTGLDT